MSICPHCGYSLSHDKAIQIDDWRIDPRGSVRYQGADIPMRPSLVQFLYAVAEAKGRPVSSEIIASRSGSEATDVVGRMRIQATILRKILRAAGAPIPFRKAYGYGFQWGASAA